MPPKLKVCGIRTKDAALQAAKCGCAYIGINLIPTSKRAVSAEFAAELVRTIGALSVPVLVCKDQPLTEVQQFLAKTGATHIQLHGSEDVSYVCALQHASCTVIKAISCIPSQTNVSALSKRIEMYKSCIVLLDVEKNHPHEKFPKSFLSEICKRWDVMFAGGISINDIPLLMTEPRPWGLDVARGIETDGIVDIRKISAMCTLLHSYS